MYRFLLLVTALAIGVAGSLELLGGEPNGVQRDIALHEEADEWDQTHTTLPATVFPPHTPGSSWSGKINPSGAVFEDGFRVFYFDRTKKPSRTIERHVDSIAVNYSWSELHNIKSENFAAYWVGMLHLQQAVTKRITLRQGWSKARLFINGKLVYEGGDTHSFLHDFDAGDHLIEVDYINEWHTTDFEVTLSDGIPLSTRLDIAVSLQKAGFSEATLHYVSTYSETEGGGSLIEVPKSDKPAILWLDSYDPVQWDICGETEIAAVILASLQPGSSIKGGISDNVFMTSEYYGVRSWTSSDCHCLGGGRAFHCENKKGIVDVSKSFEQLFAKPLTSFSVGKEGSGRSLTKLNDDVWTEINRLESAVSQQERECES